MKQTGRARTEQSRHDRRTVKSDEAKGRVAALESELAARDARIAELEDHGLSCTEDEADIISTLEARLAEAALTRERERAEKAETRINELESPTEFNVEVIASGPMLNIRTWRDSMTFSEEQMRVLAGLTRLFQIIAPPPQALFDMADRLAASEEARRKAVLDAEAWRETTLAADEKTIDVGSALHGHNVRLKGRIVELERLAREVVNERYGRLTALENAVDALASFLQPETPMPPTNPDWAICVDCVTHGTQFHDPVKPEMKEPPACQWSHTPSFLDPDDKFEVCTRPAAYRGCDGLQCEEHKCRCAKPLAEEAKEPV